MGQRPRDLIPTADPYSMLGIALRDHRTKHGLSLAQLSTRVTYDRSYLAKWERAERKPTRDQVAELDSALSAGGTLSRLLDYVEALDSQPGTRGQLVTDVANHDLHVANQVANVASTDYPRGNWAPEDAPDVVAVPAQIDGNTTMVGLSRRMLLGGLGAAALGNVTGTSSFASEGVSIPSDTPPVDFFRQAKLRLMDRDNLRGPAVAISQAQQHLVSIEQLAPQIRGDERHQLTEVQTQMADLTGWLYQDAGHWDAAHYWISQSIELSHLVDQQVTAFMFARRSQMLAELGDGQAALDTALTSIRLAQSGSRISAVAHTFAGHAYALLGEEADSSEHYTAAHANVSQMDEDGPGAAYALFMCPAYVDSYEGHSLSRLGLYDQASQKFDAALRNLDPGMYRDRGVYTAWLAQSLANAKQHDESAQRGLEALAIAAGTGSARIYKELRSLDELLPTSAASGVRAFRNALSDIDEKEG